MTITAYPLTWPAGWPRTGNRRRAKFGKTETKRNQVSPEITWKSLRAITIFEAVRRVRDELRRLGATDDDCIISSDLKLRLDGLPRSDQAQPKDPGVAVYWQPRDGGPTKVMAIDLYDKVADNLAAIAATLEAMRAIERHGGAQILERAFTGFDALPPPPDCWEVLGLDGSRKPDRLAIDAAYRRKAKEAHPDMGGSEDAMQRLNNARKRALEIVEAAFASNS